MKNNIKAGSNEQEYERIVIPTYSINSTITPVSFKAGEVLEKFEEGFDRECIDFIKQAGCLDEDNGAYMDQRIDSLVSEALKELDREYAEHKRTILGALNAMHEGDRVFSTEILNINEKELIDLMHRLEVNKKVFHKGTAFEDM